LAVGQNVHNFQRGCEAQDNADYAKNYPPHQNTNQLMDQLMQKISLLCVLFGKGGQWHRHE
jgi:hypothetical protein